MQGADWARLSHPFPPEALGWCVVEVSDDRTQVRLAPYLPSAALFARLDEVVGRPSWSCQLLPMGERALVCNLTIAGVTRSAVAPANEFVHEPFAGPGRGSSEGAMSVAPRVEELAELAISACAEGFGVPLPGVADGGWVDADAETSEPLYTPSLLAPPSAASSAPLAAEAAQDEQREQRMATLDAVERPDGHVVIDRLVERLKAEGLGKQAAQLVVTHNGYGSTPEESRELYGKLRSLLLERAVVTP